MKAAFTTIEILIGILAVSVIGILVASLIMVAAKHEQIEAESYSRYCREGESRSDCKCKNNYGDEFYFVEKKVGTRTQMMIVGKIVTPIILPVYEQYCIDRNGKQVEFIDKYTK